MIQSYFGCRKYLTELGPGRPSAGGPSRIVVRIQLHTPRLAPAALASVEVSGNRGNDKSPWRWEVSRNRRNNKIPWKNDYCQGILSFLLFIDTFWIQKCLETGKTTKSLENYVSRHFPSSRGYVISPVSRHFHRAERRRREARRV